MLAGRLRLLLISVAALLPFAPVSAGAEEAADDLPPYRMVRSLLSVQDGIVQGDQSAAEMQRFMLATIDKRLRDSKPDVFRDPRNVDAAMIYAMSGGNPATLAELAARDINGYFDNRLTDSVRQYLNGKGPLTVETLTKVLPEYKNSRIVPYLYLVLANASAQQAPKDAIKYFDLARLESPGTIIEESALRRGMMLAIKQEDVDRSFRYGLIYARRFLSSPYVGQFADAFVDFAVTHHSAENEPKIVEILSFFDNRRQREVYLRIARRAAINGLSDFARLAAERAAALSENPADGEPRALADLYSGLVNVPTADIVSAVEQLSAIPETALSPEDKALREAARAMAEQVLKQPEAESLTQATPANVATDMPQPSRDGAGQSDSPFAATPATAAAAGETPPAETAAAEGTSPTFVDPQFGDYLSQNKNRIEAIDALLKKDK